METFRTSRMTAPGAAAGCWSRRRAARSGSLIWPAMSCSSCSTTIPARPSAGAFRFPREHLVKPQTPAVGHSASSSPTLISTSYSLPTGSASSTQPNSGRWSLTTRARSHRLLRPRPEACRRAAAEVAADHARPGEERSSVFADRILSLLKLPEYSTIYLIQAVMLLSCHHNRCHGRRCDDATC